MKKTLFVCCALALALCAQAQWKPAGDKIKTQWAEQSEICIAGISASFDGTLGVAEFEW